MEQLMNKIATIIVDYLFEDGLYLGDTVKILDERQERFFLGTRRVIRVGSLTRPGTAEKEIFESEVNSVRTQDAT
jgi:hypothetical protein